MAAFNNATSRIHSLEKERQTRLDDVERRRNNISAASAAAVTSASAVANFEVPSGSINALLSTNTVGLVTHEDFKARRENLERTAATEREQREIHEAAVQHSRNRKTLEKRKRKNRAVLSFQEDSDDDDNEEEDDDDDNDDEKEEEKVKNIQPKKRKPSLKEQNDEELIETKRKRLRKDPTVDTKFLPDRDRERAERTEREKLKLDWLRQQQEIKNQVIKITYSYWDGSGHRRVMSCKKGTTIGRFLAMVQTKFKQLRNASADSLMYIKEDLIIPHHYSFYDFVVMKARGKSGPLFNFDVKEDVRVVDDATREKEDAHASKVVERRWYERNRHIFPASRWEVYDPTKKYDRYTVHGE